MASEGKEIRVCIDARLVDGRAGGVQQYVMGIAEALCRTPAPGQEYYFLCYRGQDRWIRPFFKGPCRPLYSSSVPAEIRRPSFLSRCSKRMYEAARGCKRVIIPRLIHVPRSDGTIERANIDVMHFTLQSAFLTDIPSIYQPHDLQHVHHPENFPRSERLERDALYREFCRRAAKVCLMTDFGKQDVERSFQLGSERVVVVPPGVSLEQPADKLPPQLHGLPETFLLYPAKTWPHKNHLGLCKALAHLRDRDKTNIPLICSGGFTEHSALILREIEKLELSDQVRFVGYVTRAELAALYVRATALVFPSQFEGWGMPVTEAFAAGLPVACSRIEPLMSISGDAALYFDPRDTEEIAAVILRLWNDQPLRCAMIERGKKRVEGLSWSHSAAMLQKLYAEVAGYDA